jgi:hypothetical protein
MLAEIRRQIDELEDRIDGAVAETRRRLQDRLDVLRKEEAAAWAAVRERAEAVDETIRQLEIDLAIAQDRLDSELAADATTFAEAVEAELRDWDASIERLQTYVASWDEIAREEAETEVAQLRLARNQAAQSLAALRASSDDAWQEDKDRLRSALDDVERRVRAAADNFHRRRRA